jgi:hypothetical protein
MLPCAMPPLVSLHSSRVPKGVGRVLSSSGASGASGTPSASHPATIRLSNRTPADLGAIDISTSGLRRSWAPPPRLSYGRFDRQLTLTAVRAQPRVAPIAQAGVVLAGGAGLHSYSGGIHCATVLCSGDEAFTTRPPDAYHPRIDSDAIFARATRPITPFHRVRGSLRPEAKAGAIEVADDCA